MEERSEKLRKLRFSDNWTKKALNMEYLPPPKGIWVATRGMKFRAETGRPQNFVSQVRTVRCDRTYERREIAENKAERENFSAISADVLRGLSGQKLLPLSSQRNAAEFAETIEFCHVSCAVEA